jgi:hypothetical protein
MQVDLGDGNLFHFDLVVHGPSRHTAVGADPGVLMSVFSIEKIAGAKEAAATK